MTQEHLSESPDVAIDRREIRRLRRLHGLTQAQLAQRAQISFGYVGHIESGRRQRVSPPVFARICDALGLGVKDRQKLMLPSEAVA